MATFVRKAGVTVPVRIAFRNQPSQTIDGVRQSGVTTSDPVFAAYLRTHPQLDEVADTVTMQTLQFPVVTEFDGTTGTLVSTRNGEALLVGSLGSAPADGATGAEVVNAGTLGANYSLALGSRRELFVTATLTTDPTAITIMSLPAESWRVDLLLTQDASGGNNITLTVGASTATISLPTGGAQSTVVSVWSTGGSADVYYEAPGADPLTSGDLTGYLQSSSLGVPSGPALLGSDGRISRAQLGGGTLWFCSGAPLASLGYDGDSAYDGTNGRLYLNKGAAIAGQWPTSFIALAPSGAAPAAPTSFTATPTAAGTQVDLTWVASTGSPAGYAVYRDGIPLDTIGNVTTYADTSVAPGHTGYVYKVQAFNATGQAGAFSATQTVNTPSGIVLPTTNLLAHYAARLMANNDGDLLSSVADQSGNGNHLAAVLQAANGAADTSAERPKFRTNRMNGKPSIDINWATAVWRLDDSTLTSLGSTTEFIVYRMTTVPAATSLEIIASRSTTNRRRYMIDGADGLIKQHNGAFLSSGVAAVAGTDRIGMIVADTATTTDIVRVNATEVTGTAGNNLRTGIRLGVNTNTGTTQAVKLEICELIVYTGVLDSTARTAVLNFLTDRYGVAH